jgi:hypothetical protein
VRSSSTCCSTPSLQPRPGDSTKDARIWARALNLRTAKGYDTAAISKAWRRLEQQQLVSRSRRGRLARVTLLDESGTGKFYRHHAGTEPYFKLPFEYWLDGWHRRLDLPAKAILLIGLSLPAVHPPRSQGATVVWHLSRYHPPRPP